MATLTAPCDTVALARRGLEGGGKMTSVALVGGVVGLGTIGLEGSMRVRVVEAGVIDS